MNGFVYLIENDSTGRCYFGSTNDPVRRINDHKAKKNRATNINGEWHCLMVVRVGTLVDARRAEAYVKKYKIRLTVENVIRILSKYLSAVKDD